MTVLSAETSQLLLIDFQARLMPAIHDGPQVAANAARVLTAARRLSVPVAFTEQNPRGLGHTIPDLAPARGEPVLEKMCFDAGRATDLPGAGREIVVMGCEAHVCVLQTVLGLLEGGARVHVVTDAAGSRSPGSHEAAMARMARHGAELLTAEMVIFEWLGSADHPAFRELVALIK